MIRFLLSISVFALCLPAQAEIVIPLSVDSVTTHRGKDVLVRFIQYNIDEAELRLETVRPIHHELLDFVDIKSFTVDGRTYVFEKCDALSTNSLQLEGEAVQVEFECFLPRGGTTVAVCTVPIEGTKFGKMTCERKEQ